MQGQDRRWSFFCYTDAGKILPNLDPVPSDMLALAYPLIYMAVYDTKVLLKRSGWVFVRNILLDLMIVGILILLAFLVPLPVENWFRWILGLFH